MEAATEAAMKAATEAALEAARELLEPPGLPGRLPPPPCRN